MKRKFKIILSEYKTLLQLLIQHDMTRGEFANKVGITQPALQQIITGRRKGHKTTLIRINQEWNKLKLKEVQNEQHK